MMQIGIDPGRVHLNAKFTKDEDAKPVSEHGERDDSEDKDCPCPIRTKEKVGGDEAGDEKHETGVNAAALGRDLHGEARQVEFHSLLEDRHAEQLEETGGSAGRAVSEECFDRVFESSWEWDHENEKSESEGADPEFSESEEE